MPSCSSAEWLMQCSRRVLVGPKEQSALSAPRMDLILPIWLGRLRARKLFSVRSILQFETPSNVRILQSYKIDCHVACTKCDRSKWERPFAPPQINSPYADLHSLRKCAVMFFVAKGEMQKAEDQRGNAKRRRSNCGNRKAAEKSFPNAVER